MVPGFLDHDISSPTGRPPHAQLPASSEAFYFRLHQPQGPRGAFGTFGLGSQVAAGSQLGNRLSYAGNRALCHEASGRGESKCSHRNTNNNSGY